MRYSCIYMQIGSEINHALIDATFLFLIIILASVKSPKTVNGRQRRATELQHFGRSSVKKKKKKL